MTVCENIAVKGNQAWICLSSAKRIDPDAIIGYSGLSKSQSFLNTDMAKVILESENDIVGWGNFNTVMSNILTRQNMSILSIASGFLFEDVDALQFTMDFKKGEMEASAFFLDENGDPAKYLLPAEKINGKALKELGGSCDMLVAFTITPKLVQKIEKLGTALGGGFFGDLKEVLKNIDGTVAFATSSGNSDYNGLLTTSGPVSDDLKRLFSQNDIPTKEDGDYLRFSKGNVTGGITLDDCAALLKGYTIGLVADFQGMKKAATDYASLPSSMSTVVVGFAPESGSLKLNLELKTADEKENFLLSAIKAM